MSDSYATTSRSAISWYFSGIGFAFVVNINKTVEMNLKVSIIVFFYCTPSPLFYKEIRKQIPLSVFFTFQYLDSNQKHADCQISLDKLIPSSIESQCPNLRIDFEHSNDQIDGD